MKRVQIYYRDMGTFRKDFVCSMSDEEFAATNKNQNHRAVELPINDWYGHRQPDMLAG